MKFMVLFLFMISTLSATEPPVRPLREVAIILTKEGYYPKSISVFEGERLKLYLTSTVEDPGCLIVESHKVFMAASKGKVTESEAVFDKSGEYSLYCPSSKNSGKIVVLKKALPKRQVASDKNHDPMLWVPKEY